MRKILAVGFEDHLGQPFGSLMNDLVDKSCVAEVSSPHQAVTVLRSAGVFDAAICLLDSDDAAVLPSIRTIRSEHPELTLLTLFDQRQANGQLVQTIAAFAASLERRPSQSQQIGSNFQAPSLRASHSKKSPLYGRQLTQRQREVLGLLRDGHSNKQIARKLDLSEGTVKVHCLAIFRELGVANRTQAALIASDVL